MHAIDVPITQHRHESFDGTALTYYVAGDGPRRMVLASGLGTPVLAWKFIAERFADEYTILMWDPRGTYRSAAPADAAALRVEDHAVDLASLVSHLGWERFVLAGWSMGVQVCLQFCHEHQEMVESLALIGGTYERLLATAYHFPGAEAFFRRLLKMGVRSGRALQPFVSGLLRSPASSWAALHLGIVSNNRPFFAQLAHELSGVDWPTYFQLALQLDAHTAAPLLGDIRVPTLVVAGTHDQMTPPEKAEELHERIAGSQLFIIPRGTHYALVEYPEILNLRLERFLRDVDNRSSE